MVDTEHLNGVDQRFADSNDATKVEIINIGTSIYYNGHRWFETESVEMKRRQLDEVQDALASQNRTHVEQQVESIRTQTEMQIHRHQSIIESHHAVVVADLREQLRELKDKNAQLENDIKDAMSLSGRIESLLGKRSAVDNAAKGDFGEGVARRQILHYYPTSEIDDVSGIAARGDMLWKLNDVFSCLVEVKNVQSVRASEVAKFERDLRVNVGENACNCGLFVSMKTDTIPGKGMIHFEFYDAIPVVYVAGVFQEPQLLRYACEILISVVHVLGSCNDKTNDMTATMASVQDLVTQVVPFCQYASKNIVTMKQQCEQMIASLHEQDNAIQKVLRSALRCQEANPWMCAAQEAIHSDTTSKRCVVVQEIVSFYTANNRFPVRTELTTAKGTWFRGENSMHSLRTEAMKIIQQMQQGSQGARFETQGGSQSETPAQHFQAQ